MESSDSENDEAPTSPIQSTPRQPVANKSKEGRNMKTKIRWTTEMVDMFIHCLNNEKSKFV